MTQDEAPLVRFHGLARTFGRGAAAVVAVYGASGEVRRDDRIAVVGVSGSGKSTLVHLLAGLDTPTAGTVDWPALGDRRALRPGPVGVVFQAPSLLPALDVTENAALPALLAGKSPAEARQEASRALDRLGLGDVVDRLPEELSGGQAQRVAIARIIAAQPALILADEPTGQVDADTSRTVVDVLIEAADRTCAALLIATHDLAVAERLAIRWTMTDGRLDRVGFASCSA